MLLYNLVIVNDFDASQKEEMMLFRYSCKDMGLNCSFVIKCETLEEATQKALEHVGEKHSADFNEIKSPAEIEQMKKSLTRSTRVVPE